MQNTKYAIAASLVWALWPWLSLCQTTGDVGAPKCRAEGRVVSAVTGAPLSKATIILQTGSPATTTDANGLFAFHDLDPGNYSVRIERIGYANCTGGSLSGGWTQPLVLRPGEHLTGIVLKMVPEGIVAGKVLDGSGSAVPRARLTFWRTGFQKGKRTIGRPDQYTAEADGTFVIGKLTQGRYYLRASSTPDNREVVYYPDAPKFADAAPLDVAPGRPVRGLTLRLRRVPLSRVRGTVRAPVPGGRIDEVRLSLARKAPVGGLAYELPAATYDADGHFTFQPTAEDEYVITGEIGVRVSGARRLFGVEEAVVAKGTVTTVQTLRLAPYAVVEGVLHREGLLSSIGGSFYTFLSRPDRYFPSGPVSGDGSFRQELLPGVYRVGTSYLGSAAYPHSIENFKYIRFNGKPITDRTVEVPAAGGKLEVTIAPDGSRVQGVVRDPKGMVVAGAFVAIWGQEPSAVPIATTADVLGRFEIQGLPAGAFQMAAWEAVDYGLVESAEFRNAFAKQTVPVTVRANSTSRANLVAVPMDAAMAGAAKVK